MPQVQTAEQLLQEHVEFLDILSTQAPDTLQAQCEAATEDFITKARGIVTLTRARATCLIKVLTTSRLNMAQRSRIITVINGKIDAGADTLTAAPGGAAPKVKLQSFMHFHNFLTKKAWGEVGQLPYAGQVTFFGNHLLKLGAANLNEPSYVQVVCAWHMARLGGETKNLYLIKPEQSYMMLTDLKTWIKHDRNHGRLKHYGAIAIYPKNGEELKAANPEIYNFAFGEDCPIEYPFEEFVLRELRGRVPARRTHSGMNTVTMMRRRPPAITSGPSEIEGITLPGFRLCQPGNARRTLPMDGPPALCDGPYGDALVPFRPQAEVPEHVLRFQGPKVPEAREICQGPNVPGARDFFKVLKFLKLVKFLHLLSTLLVFRIRRM